MRIHLYDTSKSDVVLQYDADVRPEKGELVIADGQSWRVCQGPESVHVVHVSYANPDKMPSLEYVTVYVVEETGANQ